MSLRQTTRSLYHALVPNTMQPRVVHFGRSLVTNIERLLSHGKPISVNVETTAACNRRCSYCPLDGSETGKLEDKVVYSVIDQLKEWEFRGRFVPSGYNEPTFDKRMTGFISYARRQIPHSDIVLLSNGDVLTEAILREWFDAGMNDIRITIHDPATPELVEKIYKMKQDHKEVRVADLRQGHRIELLQNRGGLVDVGPVENMPACYHVDAMYIRADGSVVLCDQDYKKTQVFGNVKEQGIVEIWTQEKFAELRADIRRGRYSLDMCKACGYQTVDIFKK